jgi:hypothetical protein
VCFFFRINPLVILFRCQKKRLIFLSHAFSFVLFVYIITRFLLKYCQNK